MADGSGDKSEEALDFLRKTTKRVDDLCLRINKVHQKNQTMFRNFKLQIQSQSVSVSHFSILTKPIYSKTVASSDMAPDPSSGLDSGGVVAQGFIGPFLLNSSFHDFEKLTKDEK